MIEKLLEQKEERDREFREETRKNFRIVFAKLDSFAERMEDKNQKQAEKTATINGKLLILIGAISGGIQLLGRFLG